MQNEAIAAGVRSLAQAWLAYGERLDRQEGAAETQGRVDGFRIVDGGQLQGESWEITDAHTSEVLASGDDGHDGFDRAWHSSWIHRDRIGDDAYEAIVQPVGDFGLPPSLAETLREWVTEKPGDVVELLR